MDIELTILEAPRGVIVDEQKVSFSEDGGTVGRKAGNGLFLPDPDMVVSSLHGRIEHKGSCFSFVDVFYGDNYI